MRLEDVIAMACDLHRGQKDKAGQPYILHPLRVMQRFSTIDEMVVAVLHDVLEDTAMPVEDMETYFKSEPWIFEALVAITRNKGESYDDFIERLSGDPIATAVKLADLDDNMHLERLKDPNEDDFKRYLKYRRAHADLLGIPASVPHLHV